jgi:hypothetical protein
MIDSLENRMGRLNMPTFAEIDRIADKIRNDTTLILSRPKLLDPDALHEAFIEKELRDTELRDAMTRVQEDLQKDQPPKIYRALTRLKQACKDAQTVAPFSNSGST